MASTARLDELKKKFDENPRRYFAPLANEHRKSGDLDQAIALCRTHLPQQPAHISGHIVLAQALFEAGSLDESRELFHTSLGLDPENLIALRYLGDIAREAEDVSTARSWYQRVLEVDPRNDEIVQLVRELDAPRPAAAIEAPPEPVADAAAPVAPSAPTPVPAEEDPRFAPLSLEHIDFDGPAPGAPSYATTDPAASESAPDESFDVHAAWSPDAPNVELPMLDEPELDPFDLHPSASAESLFDANAGAPPEDIFMTELADLSSPEADVSQVDPEYSVGDAWAAAPEAQPAAASPAEEAPTAIVEAESTAFEEGAFYVEPIAETPVEASVPDQATIDASTAETALWELPEAPQASATTDVPEAAAAEPELADASAFDVLDAAEPNAQEAPNAVAEVVESFADAPTAEWQTSAPAYDASPADASEQALGLEVMEFVPPPSDASATPVAEYTAAMDDRAEDSTAAEPSATPSAFVTETMAELYLQQGFRNEALAVYRELLSRSPDDSSLRDRIDQIERGSLSSIGSAAVSEDVVESALRRHSAKPARSVRSFFASLAGRRAPYQPQAESDGPAADVSAFAPVEHDSVAMGSDAAPEVQSWSNPEQISASEPTAESARITPLMSAAETLASYDPFADATDAPMTLPMDDSDALAAMPNVELPVLPVTPPVAPQSRVDDAPARRTLEDLFPDAPIAPRTEAAAETLATAFGRPEPQGRPTRAASSELSLDKVFRGSTDGAPPADGGFSFDQFFSDARPGGGDVAAPTMSPPETGRSGGAGGDAHDIEQFTAWLEGLKKK